MPAGFLNRILGGVQEAVGLSDGAPEGGFAWTITDANVFPADLTIAADTWADLGGSKAGYTVPAQQLIALGYGAPVNAGHNQGYLYVDLKSVTGAAQADGLLRISVADANQYTRTPIWEGRTEELRGDQNDINKRVAFPLNLTRLAGEDDLIIVSFRPDSAPAGGLDASGSTIRIPATRYPAA